MPDDEVSGSGTLVRRALAAQVAGLAAVTSNAAEMHPASAKIPSLWRRFSGEGWGDRLGDIGARGPTMAVYSDYQSGVNGMYRLLVGREVAFDVRPPDGFEIAKIPAGPYLVFHLQGELPQIVMDAWRHVWKFFETSDTFRRAYTADVEVYPDAADGVELWIAVR